jgi:hypothetical protein
MSQAAKIVPIRKDDTATLREVTDLRMQLLREGVQKIRSAVSDAEKATLGLLEDGRPETGLADALQTARAKLGDAAEILRRVEEHQFHGHREG